MNQTRNFLLIALLAVAYFLFMAWEKDYMTPPPAPAAAATAAGVPNVQSGAAPSVSNATGDHAPSSLVTVTTDVLRLTIDTRGGSIVRSELLDYPVTPRTKKDPNPAPVTLFDDSDAHYFVAQNGLVSSSDAAVVDQPNHLAMFQSAQADYTLAAGQNEIDVPLTWQDAKGLKVTKTYRLTRGSYVVALDQKIANGGGTSWQGNAYTQLLRAEPPHDGNWLTNMSNPEARSFQGAAWYTGEKFEKLSFKDLAEPKDKLDASFKGGWAAMLRLYFFAAWIPPADETASYSTDTVNPDSAHPRYLIRAIGPTIDVAPGQSTDTKARLYVGPNRQGQLDAVAPGLDLTIDYGMFKAIAVPMHGILSFFHSIVKNWGLAIVLLVLLIKGATWKLTALQFRSGAKMRKLQPRIQALKERYGDDKAKLQQAQMELYKKEKVNPMAGCLPVLITMPVFFALLYVLEYSLELRQASFLWIPDLSAHDPYYILPVIFAAVQIGTQLLNPAVGMDPAQAKMMKVMPLIFSVMFAFYPAGLCLYYAVNGLVGLGQQWWITHHVEREEAAAKAA